MELAARHPARVHSIDEADFFFIPFAIMRSKVSDRRGRAGCPSRDDPSKKEVGYERHENRLESLAKALMSMPLWKRRPRAFFFQETVWYFQNFSPKIFQVLTWFFKRRIYEKASWGLGSSGHKGPDVAGCTVVFPWFPRPHLYVPDVTYEVWNKRSISLWYRYSKNAYEGNRLRKPLLLLVQEDRAKRWGKPIIKSMILSRNTSVPTFVTEFHDSKFCLHLHNDDPSGHRFFDAIGAFCLPVVISDGHYPHFSPFRRVLKYTDFSLNIPEETFMNDPTVLEKTVQKALDDPARMKTMFNTLLEVRKAMIPYHPQTKLIDYTLSELKANCGR
jgi:hypothetical protein